MKISVLMPTRKRVDPLIASINSLLDNLSSDNDIEILLRFDDDDLDTVGAVKKVIDDERVKYFIGPRYGYPGFYRYINQLASEAKGDWLMLMNDDALMQTKNWDKEVEKYDGKMVFLDSNTNHGIFILIFSIVPRKVFDILGHFSLSSQCDTWLYHIGEMLKINVVTPIHIFHDRADLTGHNRDTTFEEREYDKDYLSAKNKELRAHDAELLKRYIENERSM